MLRIEDFKFDKKDISDEHEDYWFKVSGETEKELTERYMEQSMVCVTDCVYSKDENVVGIKRLFPFNNDVIIAEDDNLKQVLMEAVEMIAK